MEVIGERFSMALKELNITNKEIMNEFNTSSQNISNLKKSDRINDLICKIADKYKININWIVSGRGEKFIYDLTKNNFNNSNINKAIDMSSNSHSQDVLSINNNPVCEEILKMNKTIVSSFISVYRELEKKDELKKLYTLLGELEFGNG